MEEDKGAWSGPANQRHGPAQQLTSTPAPSTVIWPQSTRRGCANFFAVVSTRGLTKHTHYFILLLRLGRTGSPRGLVYRLWGSESLGVFSPSRKPGTRRRLAAGQNLGIQLVPPLLFSEVSWKTSGLTPPLVEEKLNQREAVTCPDPALGAAG